jgi:hypothetical protein
VLEPREFKSQAESNDTMWSYLGIGSNTRMNADEESGVAEKQRLRLVVRVTVTNSRELAGENHSCGWFVSCCAPTDWIDKQGMCVR